jgi:hypothetical protein
VSASASVTQAHARSAHLSILRLPAVWIYQADPAFSSSTVVTAPFPRRCPESVPLAMVSRIASTSAARLDCHSAWLTSGGQPTLAEWLMMSDQLAMAGDDRGCARCAHLLPRRLIGRSCDVHDLRGAPTISGRDRQEHLRPRSRKRLIRLLTKDVRFRGQRAFFERFGTRSECLSPLAVPFGLTSRLVGKLRGR